MKTMIQLKTIFPGLLGTLALLCFGLLPVAHAVVPAPDGGYAGANTAEGQNALYGLTSGRYDTAIGFLSLRSNAAGNFNTAIGAGTLFADTADDNTATGAGALFSNTMGASNTANGAFALFSNSTGDSNTATGYQALFNNQGGGSNAACGRFALYTNTAGNSNTAIGSYALAVSSGNNNIGVGYFAGQAITSGSNNIDIGADGVNGDSGAIRIGNGNHTAVYIAGIAGQAVGTGGTTCYVDNAGQLGVFLSARRFKTDIIDMGSASEGLLSLRPVSFHYKPELDKIGIPQFGLVAEEVEAVNPDLVTRDKDGRVSTVRYEAINAMLLNEFLKEHCKVQEQEGTIAELKKDFQTTIAQLKNEIDAVVAHAKEQDSKIQGVSVQVELNKVGSTALVSKP